MMNNTKAKEPIHNHIIVKTSHDRMTSTVQGQNHIMTIVSAKDS